MSTLQGKIVTNFGRLESLVYFLKRMVKALKTIFRFNASGTMYKFEQVVFFKDILKTRGEHFW